MSISGIRSNRGDSYQTLVAIEWVLTILSDPDFQWIEIDSVTYSIDDVVVGKTDGTLICCQCEYSGESVPGIPGESVPLISGQICC